MHNGRIMILLRQHRLSDSSYPVVLERTVCSRSGAVGADYEPFYDFGGSFEPPPDADASWYTAVQINFLAVKIMELRF